MCLICVLEIHASATVTGFRGWGGFRGRNYDRNSQAVDDVTTNNRDEPN